jgi:hypothetical protein
MKSIQSYLEKYALLSLEKQEKFARLIGEHTLEFDFESGLMRFSGEREFPFQVLGTESNNTLTWLWAWADEQAEINPALLKASLKMKSWGEQEGISECTSPSIDINRADGTILSLIACQICDAACYYQDSYDGGALFLLLFGQDIERQPPLDAEALARQFSNLAALFEVNHRNALRSYLEEKGLPLSEEETAITGELETGEVVRAEFDHAGAVKTLNGKPVPEIFS